MWNQYKRVCKKNGAICLFGTEPFSSMLRMSNLRDFKYDWIWEKSKCANFMNSKIMPLKKHEIISVFYQNQTVYNPQMKVIDSYKRHRKGYQPTFTQSGLGNPVYQESDGNGYPTSILYFQCPSNSGSNANRSANSLHPTQKPVDLLEYLIRTYTNDGELVLDNCFGSGSTAIACLNTHRRFIGMELNQEYFDIAKKRIENHFVPNRLF